jgi:hypothetical protein
MTYASITRTAGTNEATHRQAVSNFDAWIIDEEFDDTLDPEIAYLRETLADSRSF